MTIHQPGRRLMHFVPLKFVQHKVTGGGRRAVGAALSLTSMIDFLVVTVVILLMTFSASGEMTVAKGVTLPTAENTLDMVTPPMVAINGSQILVNHAREMGSNSDREPPFFFCQPADAVLVAPPGETVAMAYPPATRDLHHEIELVVAIGRAGRDIALERALDLVFGYAVGLDMTRRDLQNDMKKQGRPWCIGKAFEQSAPIGPITPAAQAGDVAQAEIFVQLNGHDRQRSSVAKLIWNIAETIEHLSAAWTLQPGDLIYTGTPEGVAAVVAGDVLSGGVTGLEPIRVRVR